MLSLRYEVRLPSVTIPTVGIGHQVLLAEFAARLSRLNYAKTTQACYLQTTRRFLTNYPQVVVEKFTPEHIEQHLHERNLSARSFSTNLANLRAFFVWCGRHKRLIRDNPCDRVEVPRWKPKLRIAPTYEEFLAVRALCQFLEEAVMVELLYFVGLRASELLSLRVGDVDLARRRVRIVGKGGAERVSVFPERTKKLITLYAWRHLIVQSAGPLFRDPHRPGRRGRNWLVATVRRLGREARLSYSLTPHILRHGFFRLCKTRGVPLEVAAKLGGHKSIRTTADVYGQMDVEDLQRSYDAQISY